MQAPWIFLIFASWWMINPPMPVIHSSVKVAAKESLRSDEHFARMIETTDASMKMRWM